MGYTIEKGKIVIWTQKVFVADDYPFNDQGENHTSFFKNLKDGKPFGECLSREPDDVKIKYVASLISEDPDKIMLKSKKSHRKLHPRK